MTDSVWHDPLASPGEALAYKDQAQRIAEAFHAAYERLAPDYGYTTRAESAKPWAEVPLNNRLLMVAVVRKLLDEKIISACV